MSRFTTNAARTDAIESTAHPLLLIEHSAQANHNGGALAFSPVDHYLYVGVGDGGGAGDPRNNAQKKEHAPRARSCGSTSTARARAVRPLLGPAEQPVLRLEARSRGDLGLRPAQPVADLVRPRDRQAVHRGCRAGPVRGDRRERAGIAGGRNYGWNAMEGMHCYTASKCPLAGDTLPNVEYSHDGGNCSITGGYVYRGPTQTALDRAVRLRRLVQRPDLDHPERRPAGQPARDAARRHEPSTSPRSASPRTGSCTRSPARAASTRCSPAERSCRPARSARAGSPRSGPWRRPHRAAPRRSSG